MRTLRLLGLSILFIIISCSSDDDANSNPQVTEQDLVGVWELIDYSSTSTTAETGRVVTETLGTSDYKIEFTNDPNRIKTSGTASIIVQETVDGNTFDFSYIINGNLNEGFHTGDWQIEDGDLITRSFETNPNEEGAFDLVTEIEEVNSDRLILKIDNTQYSSEGSSLSGTRLLTYTRL